MKNAARKTNTLRDLLGLLLIIVTPMIATIIPLDVIAPISKTLAVSTGLVVLALGLAVGHRLNPQVFKSQKDNGPSLADFTL